VSSPLDRIEALRELFLTTSLKGTDGPQQRLLADAYEFIDEVAPALVNVAKAAERQAQREPGSLDTAIRDALAALNKEPA